MTATCAGCGQQQDGAKVGGFAEPVWLGYGCGCLAAFARSEVHYTKAAAWARAQRQKARGP